MADGMQKTMVFITCRSSVVQMVMYIVASLNWSTLTTPQGQEVIKNELRNTLKQHLRVLNIRGT
jgi:flagellar basal body-associated protein FliL